MLKVLLSLFLLGMQGYFYFMIVAFSMTTTGTNKNLIKFLDISIYAVPATCVIAGILVILDHIFGWNHKLWWVTLPLAFAIAFVVLRFNAFKG